MSNGNYFDTRYNQRDPFGGYYTPPPAYVPQHVPGYGQQAGPPGQAEQVSKLLSGAATKYGLSQLGSGAGAAEGTGAFFSATAPEAAASQFAATGTTPAAGMNLSGLGAGAGGAALIGAGGLGIHKGIQNIEAGDPVDAALYTGAGVPAAIAGTGLLGGALGVGGLGSLTSLGVLGPAGLIAAGLAGGGAYGQQQRWGKGRKKLNTIRRQMIQDRFKELGLLDENVGGIEGATGFDLGDRGFVHVGEGTDPAYQIAMGEGEIDPDVFMSEIDRARMKDWQDKGHHYGDYIDWTQAGQGENVAAANPLGLLVAGGDTGDTNQIATAYLTNALQKMGDREAGLDLLKSRYATAGYDSPEAIISGLGELANTGAADKWKVLAAQNEINKQYGLGDYAGGGTGLAEISPEHQAAFDAYTAKQDEIRGV